MAHTMIATKAVERMYAYEDELGAMQDCIDQDFMGEYL